MKKQLSLLIQLVLFSAFLSAQGEIEVTLGDLLTQEPIAGYTVNIENPAIGFQAAGQTDANGKLRFKGLALNGIYRIFTPGDDRYDSAEAAGIELRSNYIRSVNLLLPQKTSQQIDEVVVRATSTSRINAINAEVASEMPLKQIEELPVVVYCPDCDVQSTLPGVQQFRCDCCGRPTAQIIQGKELEIISLEYTE